MVFLQQMSIALVVGRNRWSPCKIVDNIMLWQVRLIRPIFMGHGGALVEAITLNRRVVGSTPALAAM